MLGRASLIDAGRAGLLVLAILAALVCTSSASPPRRRPSGAGSPPVTTPADPCEACREPPGSPSRGRASRSRRPASPPKARASRPPSRRHRRATAHRPHPLHRPHPRQPRRPPHRRRPPRAERHRPPPLRPRGCADPEPGRVEGEARGHDGRLLGCEADGQNGEGSRRRSSARRTPGCRFRDAEADDAPGRAPADHPDPRGAVTADVAAAGAPARRHGLSMVIWVALLAAAGLLLVSEVRTSWWPGSRPTAHNGSASSDCRWPGSPSPSRSASASAS